MKFEVTRATLSGEQIKLLLDGKSKPVNMGESEKPYDFLSRIYNELAASKINTDRINNELLHELIKIRNYLDDVAQNNDAQRVIDSANIVITKAMEKQL